MTAHLKVSDEVVESTVGDEVILLHLGSGQYFSLDAIGSLVWNHIKLGTELNAMLAQLANEFDAAIEQIESDVQSFLSDLFANDILLKM